MAQIMCTQKLWRRLGYAGRPPLDIQAPTLHNACLGSWAAKVFRYYRKDLVIGLNERTYLTVVFPLAPRAQFRFNFAAAVADALADLGLPMPVIRAESVAVEFEPLTRLTSRSMAGTLNDLEFHCGIELEYHEDLRRVQRNLNDIPHVNRDPCVPVDAVARLFQGGAMRGSYAAH
jgi:hypothetical protein